jgi:hypothetical protein
MYKAPELTRFGSFREITLTGRYGPNDGAVVLGDGCTFTGPPPVTRCGS